MSIYADLKKTLTYNYYEYSSCSSDRGSGNINLNRKQMEELPKLEKKIFQQNYPNLYDLLKDCLLNISIARKEEDMNVPGLGQMDALVKYYGKKYGIEIHLCHITEAKNLLEELFMYTNLDPFGFILVSKDYGHVTPFLFHAREGNQELLIMDTCGINGICSTPCENMMLVPIPQTCRRMISEENRQADYGSCNTEAAVLLRNALIHIQHLGSEFTSLENLIKPMPLKGNDIKHLAGEYPSLEKQLKSMPSNGNDLICQLPAQWTYIDQITSSITSDEWKQSCIKQLVSKNNPSTIRQVHNRWLGPIISVMTIKNIPEDLVESVQELASSYSDIKYENNTITCKIEKVVNNYLAKKSQRHRFLN